MIKYFIKKEEDINFNYDTGKEYKMIVYRVYEIRRKNILDYDIFPFFFGFYPIICIYDYLTNKKIIESKIYFDKEQKAMNYINHLKNGGTPIYY